MTAAVLVEDVFDKDIFDEFFASSLRRGLRPTYLRELRRSLRRIEERVGRLEVADEEAIARWWDALSCGIGTRLAYLAHLRSFYRWLYRTRRRDDDPTLRLDVPRMPRALPRPIADADLRRAMEEADESMRAMLALGAFGGLRACEVASLSREDVLVDLGVLLVRDGKGGKQRTVPLHHEIGEALEALPGPGFLFRSKSGRPLSPNTLSHRANRHLHAHGVAASFHQLRHWFATNVYRQSLDLLLTQELLGHASPATTARYTAFAPEKAAAVVSRLTV